MMRRRLIYYFILTTLDFLIHFVFILFFMRDAYNTLGMTGATGLVNFLYWLMRFIIVLLYTFVAFRLAPNTNKQFRLLLGLISGVGFQVFSFIAHETFDKMIIKSGNYTMTVFIIAEYLLLIICMEMTVRIKLRQQLKNLKNEN